METEQQETLSELLARNREGQLTEAEVSQLDALMQVYRRGLVRKAKPLKVAVSRIYNLLSANSYGSLHHLVWRTACWLTYMSLR